MMLKLALVGLVAVLALASAASGSAIKGGGAYREELPQAPIKGERLVLTSGAEYQQRRTQQLAELSKTRDEPVEQQQQQRAELSKTQEHVVEEQHREELLPEQQKLEEVSQQREEQLVAQQKEELTPPAKSVRYEARPQVQLEEPAPVAPTSLAKGQKLEEKREESLKTPLKSSTGPQKPAEELKGVAYEQQRETSAGYAYEQQQQQQLQQVEVRDSEQRRYEEQQQQQQLQFSQQYEEQRTLGVKGAAPASQLAEPEPYAFDYSIEGSSRRESGDTNGVVRGQYTLQQSDGSSRVVDYVADRNGFRASVNTNEFGTETGSPAGVELRSAQPAAQDISLRLEGKTREFLAPPAAPLQPAAKGSAAPLPPKPDNWNVKGAPLAPPSLALPLQQEQVVQLEEAPRAVKGAVKLVEQTELKATPEGPAKGLVQLPEQQQPQRLETVEATPQVQLVETAPAVVKSAELRTPKAIGAAAELKQPAVLKARSGFVSATAHRPVVGVPLRGRESVLVREAPLIPGPGYHHRYQAPVPAITRGYTPVQAARSHAHHYQHPHQHQYQLAHRQPAAALRSQLQHDRYPASPISHEVARLPPNPRVSFYNTNTNTNNPEPSEDLPIGFEASS